MKVLVVGDVGERFFNDDTFERCMTSLIEDKESHCGKRSCIDDTSISSLIVPGPYAPQQLSRWAVARDIYTCKLSSKGDFYDTFTAAMDMLVAGDAVILFSGDDIERNKGIASIVTRSRRKLHEFTHCKESGWSLVPEKKKLESGNLF